jgi:PAS domain S-box-containing protein
MNNPSHKVDSLELQLTALSHIDDAVLITESRPLDRPGPRIVYANESFTRMTGYTLDEIVGQTPRVLQGPETSDEARAKIRAALERWEPVRLELTNYRKDGTTFEVDLSIQPIRQGDWVTHWVAVQRDVTEARARERIQLHEDRLRALGVLAGSVAHDFNNILHALGVMVELVEMEGGSKRLEKLTRDMRYALEKGNDMATRLLSFSRPDLGAFEEVDLMEVLERTIGLCLRGTDTTHTLHTASRSVRVMADPTQVSQVFMNLALNARQAMSDAGHLDVWVRGREDGWVEVSFEDDGPGFGPGQLTSALEPFHTTRQGGTGLGLSIVHGIVTHMGGQVSLGASARGGARVSTTWEVIEDEPLESNAPLHVLVVEDDELNQKLTMQLLEVLGYTSQGTSTAEQALELIAHTSFDAALIDINLGSGMKGPELAERLAASNTLDDRIVFMSANHEWADRLGGPGDHFLAKPFSRPQLDDVFKRLGSV